MHVSREQVDQQIEKMAKLPIVPQILIKLNKVATNNHASAEDLGKIILKDQALTLRILKVVNSAYYRRHHQERITTVSKAVVLIGFDGVRRLALGMSVHDMLRSAGEVPYVQDFWSHSLATAIAARLLSDRFGYQAKEEVFVAGLVHDIGKLILARCAPDVYAKLLEESPSPDEFRTRERQYFGLSHVQAGKKLAKLWGMPELLQGVIGDHHAHDNKPLPSGMPTLYRLVVIANRFIPLILDQPDDKQAEAILADLSNATGMNELEIEYFLTNVIQEYSDLARTFEVGSLPAPKTRYLTRQVGPDVDHDEMILQLTDISAALIGQWTPDELIDRILDGIMAALSIERLFLSEFQEGTGQLSCLRQRGAASDEQAAALNLSSAELDFGDGNPTGNPTGNPAGDPAGGPAAAGDPTILTRPILIQDPAALTRLGPGAVRLFANLRSQELATIPLIFRNHPVGVLWLDNPTSGRRLTEPMLEAATTFGNSLALVLGSLLQPV
ncbi:MAG: HDOD domain-containing protein [bacterium]